MITYHYLIFKLISSQSLNLEGRQGTTDDAATIPFHPSLPAAAFRESPRREEKTITIATWNVRTLRATGKVEQLLHEMDRYKWSILELCEMRWKLFKTILL